jgi:hypothetical protein
MLNFSFISSLITLFIIFFAMLKINHNYRLIVNDLEDEIEKLKINNHSELKRIEDIVIHNRHAIHKLSKPKRRVSATRVSAISTKTRGEKK